MSKNVAEEIESVGLRELAEVKGSIRQALLRLIKLLVEHENAAARKLRGEIVGFLSEARRRFAPSMGQRIDLDHLWRSARNQALAAGDSEARELVAGLPEKSPISLDDVLAESMDVMGILARVRSSAGG
jgi:hypothetical protein